MTNTVWLCGLPGSGKSKVAQHLIASHGYVGSADSHADTDADAAGCEEWRDFTRLPPARADEVVVCVIDVRSQLQQGRDDWLAQYLAHQVKQADVVLFSFLENAALDDQAWWSQWIRQHAAETPIVRWLNQQFPEGWQGFEASQKAVPAIEVDSQKSTDLQRFQYPVGRLVLDHLLMGLDSSKQNLGMRITRVQGVVMTLEYENAVAIEGSAYRWDMFAAAESDPVGWLLIEGCGLNQAWLDELVEASRIDG